MADTIVRLEQNETRVIIGGSELLASYIARADAAAVRSELAADTFEYGEPPEPPAPPPAPPAIGSVTDLATPGMPASGDVAAWLNAELLSRGTVIVEQGIMRQAASAVLTPSHSKLLVRDGPPAEIRGIPGGFSRGPGSEYNAIISNVAGAEWVTVRNLRAYGAGVGPQMNSFKHNGLRHGRFEETISAYSTGYGHFASYAVNHGDCSDIVYDRAGSIGCEHGFEQLGAWRVHGTDCWAEDGDGSQVIGSFIHPYLAVRDITFIRFQARGQAAFGVFLINMPDTLNERIGLYDCDIEVTEGANVIQVSTQNPATGNTRELLIVNGSYRGPVGPAFDRAHVRILGDTVIEARPTDGATIGMDIANSEVQVGPGVRLIARASSAAGSVFGINLVSGTVNFAGRIEAPLPHAAYYPVSGPGLAGFHLERAAKIMPGPFDITAPQTDMEPAHIGAPLRFLAAAAQTYRIPADTSDTTLPIGTRIRLERLGAGIVTVTALSGVTLYAPDGAAIDTVLGKGELVKSAANAWTLALTTLAGEPLPPPPELGPNLVLNGDGTGTAAWTATNATLSTEGGRLRVTNAGGGVAARAHQSFATEVGKTYAVSAEQFTGTGGGTDINIGNAGPDSQQYVNTDAGTVNTTFVATTTEATITLKSYFAGYGEFDNISVAKVG